MNLRRAIAYIGPAIPMSRLSTQAPHLCPSGAPPDSPPGRNNRPSASVGVWCAAVLLWAAGCGAPRVNLSEGPREYLPTDYDQILSRWTRTEHLIALSELDDLLTVTSTFESWDFRWAYVVRYAEDYRLSVEQRRV